MTPRMTVLASGSSGNSTLIELNGGGLLIDAGLGPRQFRARLGDAGSSWDAIAAVLLTHTHGDHWNAQAFNQMLRRKIPLYCHAGHLRALQLNCPGFADLQWAELVRTYDERRAFTPLEGIRCRAFPVQHDGGPTFGFRMEGAGDLFSANWAIGYAADLGCYDSRIVGHLVDADILALEFNHDVDLQLASRRAPWLIRRVLSDHGHLSNHQGACLLRECLDASQRGHLKHVVQLHLSRECNRRELAVAAAQAVLEQFDVRAELHTAEQHCVGKAMSIEATGLTSASPGVATN
jgi:phosphoribosyl 1,2-cyclic phosphodiesterase